MDYTQLIGYIVSLITLVGGWIIGRFTRKSSAIETLMATIDGLSKQVSGYQARIIDLQNEIIAVRAENAELQKEISEVRRENADLKEGQAVMTKKIDDLKNDQQRHRPPGPVMQGKSK